MSNHIKFTQDGKEYETNKRYRVEGTNDVYYFKSYTNKKGEVKYYKYYCKRTGRKPTGRPKGYKTLINEKLKTFNNKQLEILYNMMYNFLE